jgi:pyruvate/2-oxoglutarate dehydrogenase complex dihydrolipoamide acyltransferase (E2) component
MKKLIGYSTKPFTANRQMVAASASIGREQNTIHSICEIDISKPRCLLREHFEKTGEKLSFTAFIVTSMARVVAENPIFNSFRKGRHLVTLDDITISVLIERNLGDENVPEPVGIQAIQNKTFRQIHEEIRKAQNNQERKLGSLSGFTWIRFIPSFLLRMFIRAASHNIYMQKRFGVIGVTAVGMFGNGALWFIPLSGATVVATVGSIIERPVLITDKVEAHEFLCLTLSFNHDIIDGAPAARFIKRLRELIENGDALYETVNPIR